MNEQREWRPTFRSGMQPVTEAQTPALGDYIEPRRRRSGRRFRLSHLVTIAILVAAVAWFFTLRPVSLGGPAAYIVVSGVSMEPTYHDGDLVLLLQKDRYVPGDIVAYRVPEGDVGAGKLVIHRVIGSDEKGYITQGDNRKSKDLWRPQQSDVVGKSWLHLPGFGSLLAKFRSPLPLALFAGAFTVYFVLTWGKPSKKDAGDPDHTPVTRL